MNKGFRTKSQGRPFTWKESRTPLLGHTPRALLVNDYTCRRHLCHLPCSKRRYAGDSAGVSFPPNPLRETGTRSFQTASVSFLRVSEQKMGLTLCTVARPTSGESGGRGGARVCLSSWTAGRHGKNSGPVSEILTVRAGKTTAACRQGESAVCREAARERVNI